MVIIFKFSDILCIGIKVWVIIIISIDKIDI